MFLDDIADAVKDTASKVADGVGAVAKEAYSSVLSPAESIAMKGLGGAASTVSGIFGNVDLFDSALDGAKAVAGVGLGMAAPLLTAELGLAKGILGGGARSGGNLFKHAAEELNPQPLPPHPDELSSSHLKDYLANQTRRDDIAQMHKSTGWTTDELNPQPLPPHPDEMMNTRFGKFRQSQVAEGPNELNPQPLPPHPDEAMTSMIKDIQGHRSVELELNPQPLPPAPEQGMRSQIQNARVRFNESELNPQPLPPSPDDAIRSAMLGAHGREVALNPQPLPPSPDERLGRVMEEDEMMNVQRGREIALNPQPLPPSPDERLGRVMEEDEMMNVQRGLEIALNPQPLPPSPVELSVAKLNVVKANRALNRFM